MLRRVLRRHHNSRLYLCEQTFEAKFVPVSYDTQVYWAGAGIMALLIFCLSIIGFTYASGY